MTSLVFIVGILIAISSALIGVPLVLRKSSMLGDGLSHVAFGAFATATVVGFAPLPVALTVVIIASILILRLGENRRFSEESLLALISTSALALGTFVVEVTGSDLDLEGYLFGDISAIGPSDLAIAILSASAVIALYIFSYHKIFAATFDETFAKSIGIKTNFYSLIFAILCSVVVILGLRFTGALLISSLLVFPVLSAKQIAKTYRGVVLTSVVFGVASLIAGLALARLFSTPPSTTIVLSGLAFFLVSALLSKIAKK